MVAGIIIVISTLVVTMVMNYLTKLSYQDTRKTKRRKNANLILRYNKAYGYFSIVTFIVAGLFGILPFTGIAPIKDSGDMIAFISLEALFIIIGILLIAAVSNIKIEVSDDKIKYWNIFKMSKEILWDDIKEVKCSMNCHELILITNKKRITVPSRMMGFTDFEMVMTRKLDKEIYKEAYLKVLP